MTNESLALFLAIGATLSFSTSSLVFAEYSKRVSVLWMNCFKATVAFCALAITITLVTGFNPISTASLGGLALSGLIGLNIGDLFLLSAFTRLGAARTLILFGFQPLMVGLSAALLFDQPFDPSRLIAVVFLIGCLVTFSLERYRTEKKWELTGLLHALAGVVLDTCGVLLTRASFGDSPDVTPIEGNFYRCFGALVGFAVMARFQPINLIQGLVQWPTKTRTLLIVASLGGTYLSLLLYLSAVKIGHLASISAIAITGPIFATAIECFLYRKLPSRYLMVAFAFFCAGFYILLRSS